MAAGGEYGFLLDDIALAGGCKLDYSWLRLYDLDLAEASGERVKCEVFVSTYYSEGAERHGRDGSEIGFCDIRKVFVLDGEKEVPLAEWATRHRKERNTINKAAKNDGTYIWPGTWTYAAGGVKVKAAKSAPEGAACDVRSKSGMNDARVVLLRQEEPGIWDYAETRYRGECKAYLRQEAICAHLLAKEEQVRLEEERRWAQEERARLDEPELLRLKNGLKAHHSLKTEAGRRSAAPGG